MRNNHAGHNEDPRTGEAHVIPLVSWQVAIQTLLKVLIDDWFLPRPCHLQLTCMFFTESSLCHVAQDL